MAKTSLTVLPKKTGPSDALKSMSIANSPKAAYVNTVASSPSATSPTKTKYGSTGLTSAQAANEAAAQAARFAKPTTPTPAPAPVSEPAPSKGPSSSLREMSSALAPRPATPDFYGKARTAMERYIESLAPTEEETKLSKNLSNLRSSISSGVQLASEQAIPMGFITGQQQAIENRGLNAIQPYQDELERLFQEREARSKGLSARQGFETALADTQFDDYRYQDEVARDERRYAYDIAKEASEPIEFNGALYQRNPDGGFTEIMAAPQEIPKPFELSEGQSRYEYNPTTGKYEVIASKGKTYKETGGTGDSSSVVQNRVNQVIDGFITLDDLTLAERQKVTDELYDRGFGSDSVPSWYNDYYAEEGNTGGGFRFETSPTLSALEGNKNKPKTVKQSWMEYRKKIMGGANSKSGGGGIDDISIDDL